MLHTFTIAGTQLKLWQNNGESYEHVLMKALGFAMFSEQFSNIEIEVKVGTRYKPDLVSRNENGTFLFWGECGISSLRKIAWIVKHAGAELLVLFKIGQSAKRLAEQLRTVVPQKYRGGGRLQIVSFTPDIGRLTASKAISRVAESWFERIIV